MVFSLTLAAAPEPPHARGDLSAAPPGSSIRACFVSKRIEECMLVWTECYASKVKLAGLLILEAYR